MATPIDRAGEPPAAAAPPRWLARFEAVNIGAVADDVQDLATVRGGGLMLLEAVSAFQAALAEKLDGVAAVKPISTGASIGLFAVTGGGRLAVGKAAEDALAAVLSDPKRPFRHATFHAAVAPLGGTAAEYLAARESTLAAVRWNQLRNPGLTAPGPAGGGLEICEIDLLRPAEKLITYHGQKDKPTGRSLAERREFGMEQKDALHWRFAGDPENARGRFFARDLHELSGVDPETENPLSGHMAVIYADGNGFTKIQKRLIDAAGESADAPVNAQRDFDGRVQDYRRDLLQGLLDFLEQAGSGPLGGVAPKGARLAGGDGAGEPLDKDRIRLETLLWGGDEFIWVVPAWLGFKVLTLFEETVLGQQGGAAWTAKDGGEALHHGAGVVFCHDKAPIARIKALVRDLAEMAKDISRDRSLVAWQVLESYDHIGRDPRRHLDQHSADGLDWRVSVVSGENLRAAADAIRKLKNTLSRRSLRRFVDAFMSLDTADPRVADRMERVFRDTPGALEDCKSLAEALYPEELLGTYRDPGPGLRLDPFDLNCERAVSLALLQLEILWDYVSPSPAAAGVAGDPAADGAAEDAA